MLVFSPSQLSDILNGVLSDNNSKANAIHLQAVSESGEKSPEEVVYTSIVNESQQMDLDEDGYVDNQTALIDAVKVHLKSRVQSLTA